MLCKDEWLSRYFDGGAYRYQTSSTSLDEEHVKKGFIYAKIPAENKAELNKLIQQDYNLVEVLVQLEQKSIFSFNTNPELELGLVTANEKEQVIAIAKDAFLSSRLFQDERIPYTVASQIKADWVANFFSGQRGDSLIVARINKVVVGFMLLVNQTTIDLIAVAPDYYKKSIGSSMIAFANHQLGLLKAGTQLNNQASLRMYEKCGFYLRHAQFVLHKFVG